MIRKYMTGNILVAVLLAVSALLQASILHRQSNPRGQAAQQLVRDAPDGSTIDMSGMPILGSDKARVVLVEFSDYECPFCRKHATSVFDEIKKAFVDTGRIRYVFANNPLAMHRNAMFLATAALCAGDQGHYWTLHDQLFREQPKTLAEVLSLMDGSGIDAASFEDCVTQEPSDKRVLRDVQVAQTLGLKGTPGFAVGHLGADGRIEVDTLISGAQPFQTFQDVLKKML